jgi:hypothetical protein
MNDKIGRDLMAFACLLNMVIIYLFQFFFNYNSIYFHSRRKKFEKEKRIEREGKLRSEKRSEKKKGKERTNISHFTINHITIQN